jgi:tRNA (guanine-N7-)-methyltransferase
MCEENKKKKDPAENYSYKENFQYTSKNPYNDKLKVFDDFVMLDSDSEAFIGKWNSEVFKRDTKLNVEIGTGYGNFMHDYCQKNPDINFVGLDYRFKRSFYLAQKLATLKEKSFKYLRAKGERIAFIFAENEIDNLYYFFPDPWPKNRHHKKRLFQKPFLDAAHKVLKNDGVLWIKTDHDGYFEWMLDELKLEQEGANRFTVELKTFDLHGEYPKHFLAQFITKFENIFLKKDIKIKSLVLKNTK